MGKTIHIGDREISDEAPCFVIAEIGHNHQGNLETAKLMIDEAAACGVDAVKLQKRNNKTLYTRQMYNKPYENENSFGKTYGEHRDALEFGIDEYLELKAYAEENGVIFFATAFDFDSVDFLESIGVPAYKIASGDITNHPLIDYIASKKKPVFISTGAADFHEVQEAYKVLKRHIDEICIMQCTAAYPAQPEDTNLNVILTYKEAFPDAVIGYSSHESGIVLPVVAYVLGARAVEKHFTLNRAMKGTDHKFSHEPLGMKKMVRDLVRTQNAMGSLEKFCLPIEREAKAKMGKSIVLARDVRNGEILDEAMIAFKSPGDGIPPSRVTDVVGRRIITDLTEETMLLFEHLGS